MKKFRVICLCGLFLLASSWCFASTTVTLYTDSGGSPSTALESWTVNNTLPLFGTTNSALISVASVNTPQLNAGSNYWLVVMTDPSNDIVWNWNSISALGTHYSYYDSSAHFFPGVTKGAFEVTGTAGAGIVFSDLSSSGTYNQNEGWGVGQLTLTPNFFVASTGDEFSPSTTATLNNIQIALSYVPVSAVPEPCTMLLLGLGLMGLAGVRRKAKKYRNA